ncbi:MAG: hypothetical protein N2V78_07245 [Methanophagales archaeon]|nr:hypothetical protein [Methanophagales archaeon]MCW3141942.1 hypothetical protein [Methanophagales archaeon]
MKELLIASAAFALFILCPRMAGMTKVISDASHVELIKVVVFGTVVALPMIIAMALIFARYGLVAALVFCVVTDFAAAFAMREISMKAGVETLIIALFVLLGVKVASIISGWMS